jgi:CcmD family protein
LKEFLSENSIYIVFLIVLVIWIGVYLFMNSMDKRLKDIEEEIKEINDEE